MTGPTVRELRGDQRLYRRLKKNGLDGFEHARLFSRRWNYRGYQGELYRLAASHGMALTRRQRRAASPPLRKYTLPSLPSSEIPEIPAAKGQPGPAGPAAAAAADLNIEKVKAISSEKKRAKLLDDAKILIIDAKNLVRDPERLAKLEAKLAELRTL